MSQDNDTLIGTTQQTVGGKLWRPIRRLVSIDERGDAIAKLQSKVQPSNTAGLANQIVPGIPKQLLSISATESPIKQQDRTFSNVSVSFTRDAGDKTYARTRIWLKGYKGNTGLVLQTEGRDGPISFLLESTAETITVYGQPMGLDGTLASLELARSATVLLDGVISAPPDPTIAQTVVAIPQGTQFQFNFLTGLSADVVDGYFIYRNTVNDSTTASKFKYVKHTPLNAGAYTFQDLTGTGTTYYYWVTAVNTQGLESNRVATGGGGGSSGGSLFISRPSTNALGTGGSAQITTPTNAYDVNESTASTGLDDDVSITPKATLFSGFPNAGFVPTSTTLKIKSEIIKSGAGTVQGRLRYSVNSGGAWTNVYDVNANRALATDSIALPAAQDMTLVRVEFLAKFTAGSSLLIDGELYEIWAECRA